jgi:hypothetical protein
MMPVPGFIDVHIHTAPDIRPRRFTDREQALLARREGASGIVLKNHQTSTVARAAQAGVDLPGLRVMGGLVLNRSAGGLDPEAVAVACAGGARIIWLPTLDADNHRRTEGHTDGIVVVSRGRPVAELRVILRIIAEHDVALATGHLAADEIRCVAEAAIAAGVRRIIINHPEHRVVAMSLEQQAVLGRDLPVFFERCFAQPVGGGRYATNLDANLAAIRALGPGRTVLATDSGQLESAPWDDAWRQIFEHHARHGVPSETLDLMARLNPAFLCGMAAEAPQVAAIASR